MEGMKKNQDDDYYVMIKAPPIFIMYMYCVLKGDVASIMQLALTSSINISFNNSQDGQFC